MMFEELNDPFDNAEQLFRSAYALSDPVPELLNLMKAHPTQASAIDLVVYYTEAVEEDPSRANALASALVTLRDSPDAPMLNDGSSNLVEVFSFELAVLHSRGLRIGKSHINFGPTNLYLINCLLSGLSFKHRLTSCSDQYGSIMKGLNAYPDGSSTSELLVIGACIQLLTNGSYIISTAKSYIKSVNEVATKLRFQKSMGTIKASNALKLLDLTISHAKSGFKRENDVDDVWELLFPSRAEKTQEKLTCIQSILACTLVATLICWACKWS